MLTLQLFRFIQKGGGSVAEWAKALFSWHLRSLGFPLLRSGLGMHGSMFSQLFAVHPWFPWDTPVSATSEPDMSSSSCLRLGNIINLAVDEALN